MDSILFDPSYDKYGDDFFNDFKEYCDKEHVHLYQSDGFFRVLPIDKVISGTKIISSESTRNLILNARIIAVQRCACRTREKRCDNPLEVCIGLDNLADYIISRDIGKEISTTQALEIIEKCEDLGLVHQTVNSKTPDVICNCCACCCGFLRSIIVYGKKAASAKSRYIAHFDIDKCTTCEDLLCAQKCIFGGITIENGKLHTDPSMCWGCGLCARSCPHKAIQMKEVRPPSHIPNSGEKFFPFKTFKE
jgi:Pyruvate/2-oxoacid:ferredoxin oxidoreductase delta subunit